MGNHGTANFGCWRLLLAWAAAGLLRIIGAPPWGILLVGAVRSRSQMANSSAAAISSTDSLSPSILADEQPPSPPVCQSSFNCPTLFGLRGGCRAEAGIIYCLQLPDADAAISLGSNDLTGFAEWVNTHHTEGRTGGPFEALMAFLQLKDAKPKDANVLGAVGCPAYVGPTTEKMKDIDELGEAVLERIRELHRQLSEDEEKSKGGEKKKQLLESADAIIATFEQSWTLHITPDFADKLATFGVLCAATPESRPSEEPAKEPAKELAKEVAKEPARDPSKEPSKEGAAAASLLQLAASGSSSMMSSAGSGGTSSMGSSMKSMPSSGGVSSMVSSGSWGGSQSVRSSGGFGSSMSSKRSKGVKRKAGRSSMSYGSSMPSSQKMSSTFRQSRGVTSSGGAYSSMGPNSRGPSSGGVSSLPSSVVIGGGSSILNSMASSGSSSAGVRSLGVGGPPRGGGAKKYNFGSMFGQGPQPTPSRFEKNLFGDKPVMYMGAGTVPRVVEYGELPAHQVWRASIVPIGGKRRRVDPSDEWDSRSSGYDSSEYYSGDGSEYSDSFYSDEVSDSGYSGSNDGSEYYSGSGYESDFSDFSGTGYSDSTYTEGSGGYSNSFGSGGGSFRGKKRKRGGFGPSTSSGVYSSRGSMGSGSESFYSDEY